jgi:hypothetical protein
MLTRPSSLQVPGGLRCGGLNSKAEMYETLSCLPMTVKENLDRAALKVSHKQWLALELSERQLIRDLPGDTDSQLRELSDLVHRLVLQRCGEKPPLMSAVQQHDALPPVELPTDLAANARELGIELAPDHWALLDEDERYVLMKLGGTRRVKHNLEAALREFLREEMAGFPLSQHSTHQP